MLFDQEMYELAQSLFQRTRDGTIRWSETAEEDSFRAVLDNGMVRVERHIDPFADSTSDTKPPYRLPKSVKGWEGFIYTLVVMDDKNKELVRYIPEHEERAAQVRNLWELASSMARNTRQKIQAIIREIAQKAKT